MHFTQATEKGLRGRDVAIRHVSDLGEQWHGKKEQDVQNGNVPGMFHEQKSSVCGDSNKRKS